MGFYFNTNSITPSGGSGGGSGDTNWGDIGGSLSNQTDLNTALSGKQDTLTAGNNIAISNGIISATNTTYSVFTGATYSVDGNSGLVPAPTINDVDSYLRGNGTWQSGIIINNATGGNLAIGPYSEASSFNTVVYGINAKASGMYALALGYYATATNSNSIQLGQGTNKTANTLQVGSYTLLDTSIGIIPNDRLNIMTGADGTNAGSKGIVPAPVATDNTKFLRGDGTWAEAGGNVDIDESTITKNTQNKLQTVSILNKNIANGATNPLQFWEGTEQEYNTGGGQKDLYYAWENKTLSTISTSQTTSSEGWWGIASGNGCIVITSGMKDYSPNNKAAYSEDNGDSWTIVDLPSSQLWRCACFGNGVFVVLGFNSNKGAYSEDNGKTWTEITLPISDRWNAIAFNGQRFVAVAGFAGFNSSNAIYSDDGKQWNTITLPVSAYFASITCNGNTFVTAGGKYCVYSTDNAESWSYILLDNNIAADAQHCVLFGNNKFLIKPSSSNYIYYASDVTSWTPHLASGLPSTFYVGAYTNGYFYIVNSSGNTSNKGYYSLDGLDWTSKDLTSSQELRGVGVINNTFVIVNNTSANIEHFTASINKYYTLEASPTTTSQVYSAPTVISTLTITSVDTNSITLSDTNVYTYNINSNEYSYYTIGEIYPNYICLIENVGIKKGSIFIAQTNGTIDQSYIPTSTNAISGVGVAQALTRPTN